MTPNAASAVSAPNLGADTARRSRYDNPLLLGPAYRLEVAEPVTLQSGAVLARHTIGFETYGTLSPARDNAVLICHSLTKGAYAAGRPAATACRPSSRSSSSSSGSLQHAFADVDARMQFASYQGDWRYPAAEIERMHQTLLVHGIEGRHTVLESDLGHGGFIYDVAGLRPTVGEFPG